MHPSLPARGDRVVPLFLLLSAAACGPSGQGAIGPLTRTYYVAAEEVVWDYAPAGRNLITAMLPEDVTLIRAWAGHPLCMVQELDASFDAVMMIGYHDAAGSEANSLAHTLSSDAVEIRLNGRRASEFSVHALASSMLGVPTVFVSGDRGLMDHVAEVNPAIGRCAVKQGRGQSTVSMTPAAACKAIRTGAEAAER